MNEISGVQIVFAHHTIRKKNSKEYLFEVPKNLNIKCGDKVLCNTCNGEVHGVVTAGPYNMPSDTKALEHAIGAKFPLKRVTGRIDIVRSDTCETEPYKDNAIVWVQNKIKVIAKIRSQGLVGGIGLLAKLNGMSTGEAEREIHGWFGIKDGECWCDTLDTFGNPLISDVLCAKL